MREYFHNVKTWVWGFTQLGKDKIPGGYKEGWGPVKFFPVYLFNIGTNVLTGGAVSTWSRSFYEYRKKGNRIAKFLDRLLGKLDDNHGEESAPAYWGTAALPWHRRLIIVATWALVIATVVWRAT
jgi:hypothetical protein